MRHGLLKAFLLSACLGAVSIAKAFDPVEAVMQGGDADINEFTNTPSFPTGMEINGAFYNSYGNFSFDSLIPNSKIDGSSVTKQGNTFNGANQLLQLGSTGLIPNSLLNGSSITLQGNTFNGANQLTKLDSNSALNVSSLNVTSSRLFASGFKVFPIVQMQQYTTSTSSSNPTTNWIMSTLSGSFTPKFSTSKIFIFANGNASQDAGDGGYLTIYRNSTNLGDATLGLFGTISANNYGVAMMIVDTPGTTSAITYAVRIKSRTGTSTIRFPHDTGAGVPKQVMNIIEVAQ